MENLLHKLWRIVVNLFTIVLLLILPVAAFLLGGLLWAGVAFMSEVLLLALIVLAAFSLANKNIIFTRIESNHICCAEIDGQFYAFFCRSEDKEEIMKAFEAEAVRQRTDINGKEHKDKRGYLEEKIKTRDTEGGIKEWLVEHFNLHLLTLNPFVTLRPIRVIRTHINTEDKSGSLDKMILTDEEVSEEFLRIKWPRPVYIANLELKNNVQTNIVAANTEFTVIDPYPVFYKNQEISRWADFEMRAAFIQHLGQMTFEDFSNANFTATDREFTTAIATKGGFGKLGLSATGTFSIVDWDLAGSQAEMQKQQQRKAAAKAKSDADIEEARGTVEVIKQTGAAKAQAAKQLHEAIANDPNAALVLMSENLREAKNTVVLGGGVMPTINVNNTPKGP